MLKRRRIALTGAAVGACAAYFLDPDRGRSRRARTKDQAMAALRRRERQADSERRYTEGKIAGAAAEASGAGTFTPEDDIDIVHGISGALAKLEFSTADVNVDVVEGVATLRGQLDAPALMDEACRAVKEVPGVVEVRSYLHTPGTPAPNKAASLKAS